MCNFTIYRDEDLESLLLKAGPRKPRLLTPELDRFLALESIERAYFLAGFQGSGRTSIMLEAMSRLPYGQCMYITIDSAGETKRLSKFLRDHMCDKDFRYIFIDDADRLEDFGSNSKFIADFVATFKRMVVAGEPSALLMAEYDPFLGRCRMRNINRLTFREWGEITNSTDLCQYLLNGSFMDMRDIGAVAVGILSAAERVFENCGRLPWSVGCMIREGTFRKSAWLMLNALALRFLEDALSETGKSVSPSFLHAVREMKESVKRSASAKGLFPYGAGSCGEFLSDIGVISSAPARFAWECLQPVEPRGQETADGEEPFDIFDSPYMEGHYFRIPGMLHALCEFLAARMGRSLPDSVTDAILIREARQAVAIDMLDMLPHVRSRTRGEKRYRLWEAYLGGRRKGPADGLAIHDRDRGASVAEALFDPRGEPYMVTIREGRNGERTVPIADFLWELPEFMATVGQ